MENISVLLEILEKILIAFGIISVSSVLTGLLNAVANIQNKKVKHVVSWVVPIVAGLILCATNAISFGYGGWDYLMAAASGALVGGASNGLYDWEVVSNFIDKFYDLFHKK